MPSQRQNDCPADHAVVTGQVSERRQPAARCRSGKLVAADPYDYMGRHVSHRSLAALLDELQGELLAYLTDDGVNLL